MSCDEHYSAISSTIEDLGVCVRLGPISLDVAASKILFKDAKIENRSNRGILKSFSRTRHVDDIGFDQ